MTTSGRNACILLLIGASLLSVPAQAFDLNGAWASDSAICNKIFVRKGSNISMAQNADFYGSGFIAEGNKIKGKMAACSITARKEEGGIINIIAACSTEVALSTTQFRLKIESDNKIERLFEGMPSMSMTYFRCAF